MISSNPAIVSAMSQGLISSPATPSVTTPGDKSGDFAQTLMDVLKDVNDSQQEAASKQQDLITGRRPVEIQDVMISMEKASTTMQLTMAVRNKVLEAYQEIERLQV
jgi:flagellar hook-basal body complex protein FliE